MTKSKSPATLITDTIRRCLQRYHNSAGGGPTVKNPARFQEHRWAVTGFCAAALSHLKLQQLVDLGSPPTRARDVLTTLRPVLGPDSVLTSIVPEEVWISEDILDDATRALLALDPAQVYLPDVYEAALAPEFHVLLGKVVTDTGSSTRGRLGSYYTPPSMAEACARKALDQFIAQSLGWTEFSRNADLHTPSRLAKVIDVLRGASVIDSACGPGRFLLAYLRCVQQHVISRVGSPDRQNAPVQILQDIARSFWAVDVDPFALEIARVGIALQQDGIEILDALQSQFVHANPLLRAEHPMSLEKRRRLFQQGFIYHLDLGLPDDAVPKYCDLVLGNPPWKRIRLEERTFFRHLAPQVAACTRKDERLEAIAQLAETDPITYRYYSKVSERYDEARQAMREDPRFEKTAVWSLNSYALFASLSLSQLEPTRGVAAILVKSGLFTTTAYEGFFRELLDDGKLVAVFDFVNQKRIFPIDSRERFSLMLAGRGNRQSVDFAMRLTKPEQLQESGRLMSIERETLTKINPLTGMLPNVRSPDELRLLVDIVRQNELFDDVYPEANFGRLVHLTTHANLILDQPAQDTLPIYEGKFVEQYDGRYAGFAGVSNSDRYVGKARAEEIREAQKANPDVIPLARYFIRQDDWLEISKNYREPWSLMWRNHTSASNRRTCIATILPHMPATQSIQFLQLPERSNRDLAILLAVMNSLVFDYVLRRKLTGIDLTQSIIRQMPLPAPERLEDRVTFQGECRALAEYVTNRVCALLSTDARLKPFCRQLSGAHPVFGSERRQLKMQLDVLLAFAYGLSPSRFHEICSSFDQDIASEDVQWLSDPANWPTRC